jgi:xanthine/uracil/vitamin C permease (AzgA family)
MPLRARHRYHIAGAVTKFDALNPTAHPAHFCYPMGAIDNLGNRVFNGAAYGTTEKPVGGGCTSASYIVFPLKFAQKAACPNTCGALSFDNMQSSAFGGALLTFLYTDILDNTATFFAVAKIGGFLNPQTLQLPAARANMAYLSDAISTIIGASLGVSTVVTYIESATGVRDGGRTGLTACFSGLFFLMCLPFSPWLSQVPALASGPALVVVGAPATNLCAVFVLADAADGSRVRFSLRVFA